MRNSIVEGEPGIFPSPIGQLYGAINRWVRRRTGKDPAAEAPAPGGLTDEQSPPRPPADSQ